MNRNEIQVGKVYLVNSYHGGGSNKAEVTGDPIKDRYSKRFEFPIRFLDPLPGRASRETANVKTTDFVREWTDQDQQDLDESRAVLNEILDIENKLAVAGYSFVNVTFRRNRNVESRRELRLTFEGEDAQRVYKLLTEGESD